MRDAIRLALECLKLPILLAALILSLVTVAALDTRDSGFTFEADFNPCEEC